MNSTVMDRVASSSGGAADLLAQGESSEREGHLDVAAVRFASAVHSARSTGDAHILARALRRLAIVRRLRNEPGSRSLAREASEVSATIGDRRLAAEAANTEAAIAFDEGDITIAAERYQQALLMADGEADLQGRIEQNLGIVANVRGDWPLALDHYHRSLERYTVANNDQGRAIVFHNLGIIAASQRRWAEAEGYYSASRSIAVRIGDRQLEGLCSLNHAELCLAASRLIEAEREASEALERFVECGLELYRADALRVLGAVHRQAANLEEAERRLDLALELARASGSLLTEAETARELAHLYRETRRNQSALKSLNLSLSLFRRLDARRDLVDIEQKVSELETVYLDVIRSWGRSIESADTYTHGHCERVASLALILAEALNLDAEARRTVQLGAYLHDVGKIRTPDDILSKPGRLTDSEMTIMQQHPVDGVRLLDGIDLPWDIRPIIRWHHEKADGSGYPDGLSGDDIPISAQVIGVADVYDALTTTRSYRPALDQRAAVAILEQSRHWWRAEVVDGFLALVKSGAIQ